MANVVAWLVAHWQELAAALGALLTLASIVTAFTATPKDDAVVAKIVAWLSFLQPRTSEGTLKVPGTSPGEETVPFSALERHDVELEEGEEYGMQRTDNRR